MANASFENGGALSWDSTIEKESDFILLEPGEYDVKITKMERGTFQPKPGSNGKIKEACPRAELELKVDAKEQGEATVFENLLLHSATEGILSSFFIAIGQKKKGEPLNPNWGQVPGSTARAKIIKDTYKNNDGKEITVNRIDRWLEPENRETAQTQNQGFAF